MASRFELRLDPERRERLHEIASREGVPASEVMRRLIDEAYADIDRARRLQAVEELADMSLEVPEDPEELYRVLDGAHEPHTVS